ncbi:hypothetical protein Afil01_54970 [Actinorhabdospora filicis]|uniref:HTH cro/C1-type domain-containing protein n=1 Tax=Actinorhabdospora filicis TaxID=1785913 RepID=A0A9W6WDC7_9ACTN|nr:helix-turn-helix transcriptional regulator [Actinorhabdospora filicis]GLZ80690.1 hypothetical protein Afil01_54970 [Actinorhabdospora filicis]
MSRRESAIPVGSGAVAQFAQSLRALRHRAGSPTYRVMAKACHYSHTALSRAAMGKRLPTWEVTSAFVAACGGDPAGWRSRYDRAVRMVAAHPGRPGPAPDEEEAALRPVYAGLQVLATDLMMGRERWSGPGRLAMELRRLKEASGLSIRAIARLTGIMSPGNSVPVSTVGDLLDHRRGSWPRPAVVGAFLTALEVPTEVKDRVVMAVRMVHGGPSLIPSGLSERVRKVLGQAETRCLTVRDVDEFGIDKLVVELEALVQPIDPRLVSGLIVQLRRLARYAVDPRDTLDEQLDCAHRQGRIGAQRAILIDLLGPPRR